ncbi:MAG: Fis family transcriptional regulator, partial [Selenomonas sp.]|uniref:helix-turn-helix domain-containing protein n=1 Tax=Selenomonas sp. TaxID=2053611 RepID=UPI0025E3D884
EEQHKSVRGITPDAMEVLMGYRWPGNVRELENVIERVITLMDTPEIRAEDLPTYVRSDIADRAVSGPAGLLTTDAGGAAVLPWADYEKRIIAHAMEHCGTFNAAAKALGITHKTVAAKARKYGLVDETK